jgi:hypothetical protein
MVDQDDERPGGAGAEPMLCWGRNGSFIIINDDDSLAQERQVPGCGAQTPSIFVGNASLDLMECEMDKMSIP